MSDQVIREFIRKNLVSLTEYTVVGTTDLVLQLRESDLLTQGEFQRLSFSGNTNHDNAKEIYANISNKWTLKEFKTYLGCLYKTKNMKAIEIFSHESDVWTCMRGIKPEKESETNPSSSKAAAEIAQKLNSEGTKKNCAGSFGIPIEQCTDKGCKLVVSKPNLEKTVRLDVSALPGSIQLLRYQFPKKVNGILRVSTLQDLTSWAVPLSLESCNQFNSYKIVKEFLSSERFRDLPVICLSVNGPERTHKSFLLAMIVQYLRHRKDPSWIEAGTGKCNIPWKGGRERVTKELCIWIEPLVVTSDGRECLVLVIDTPGVDTYTLFNKKSMFDIALTASLSSIFIYNSTRETEALSNLVSLLKKLEQAGIHLRNLPVSEKLILVQRDWSQELSERDTYKCGFYDDPTLPYGQSLNLKDTLLKNLAKDAVDLTSTFREFCVYAMPQPQPSCVPRPGHDATDWDPKFKKYLDDFMQRTMHPDNLVRFIKKHPDGSEMTAGEFADMAKEIHDRLVKRLNLNQ